MDEQQGLARRAAGGGQASLARARKVAIVVVVNPRGADRSACGQSRGPGRVFETLEAVVAIVADTTE